jgi:hypothetical protein
MNNSWSPRAQRGVILQTPARRPLPRSFRYGISKQTSCLLSSPHKHVDVREHSRGYFPDPIRSSARIVRFTPEGSVVVALVNQTIYVLSSKDLTELRTIPLASPASTTRIFRGNTIVSKPSVRTAEISPNGSYVAVLWVTDSLRGEIQIYGLSSGRNELNWETPFGWVGSTRALVWHPNGKLLLVAIPSETPCLSPTSSPDVFGFDVQTGAVKYKFTTGLLTESIAVTADNSVLAVNSNCLGVFKNHDPKLKVFDLVTGKHLLDISGRGTGVRYFVSASADGSRFLAYTGKMKANFDWGDFVPIDVMVDRTFSVWSLANYQGIVTSHDLTELKLRYPRLLVKDWRLSARGRYVLAYGDVSFVYALP